MIRITALLAAATFAAMATFSASSNAATVIGTVSRIELAAQSVTEGEERTLVVNTPVHLDDVITTGQGGRLEITLTDGTRITLGENARLQIDTFVYSENASNSKIDIALKGAFRFVTGKAGKAPDRNIQVKTPVAIIGVRGTDFLAARIDGQNGVLLFSGAVMVANPQGQVLLDRPGLGTNIADSNAAPSPPSAWPQEKVTRALATVAFQ